MVWSERKLGQFRLSPQFLWDEKSRENFWIKSTQKWVAYPILPWQTWNLGSFSRWLSLFLPSRNFKITSFFPPLSLGRILCLLLRRDKHIWRALSSRSNMELIMDLIEWWVMILHLIALHWVKLNVNFLHFESALRLITDYSVRPPTFGFDFWRVCGPSRIRLRIDSGLWMRHLITLMFD